VRMQIAKWKWPDIFIVKQHLVRFDPRILSD